MEQEKFEKYSDISPGREDGFAGNEPWWMGKKLDIGPNELAHGKFFGRTFSKSRV